MTVGLFGQPCEMDSIIEIAKEKKIWILDEPMATLDTAGIEKVNECIANHLKRKGAVLITSHQDIELEPARKFDLTEWCL